MSATPIPRTLAMVIYCDTDVSIIDEMPPGRQKVDTFLVTESYRERLNAFIRKNVDAGGQVYIVCPAVEEEETLVSESGETLTASDLVALGGEVEEKPKLKAAVAYAKLLSEEVFPEYRSAFVHGKLNGKEKDRIMNTFASGELDILVSTTVIEVGVNVPNATLMIVENAETFGLSALHQLRGRVGRGSRKSYCVLVSDSKTQKAKERLGILCKSNDGFAIAQKDLEMRGPGDFLEQSFGKTRQSGEFDLGIASLEKDVKLLYTAFDEAKRVIAQDPALESEENRLLAKTLKERVFKRQGLL
jgi:ATP-dependent DNA helicase RecG